MIAKVTSFRGRKDAEVIQSTLTTVVTRRLRRIPALNQARLTPFVRARNTPDRRSQLIQRSELTLLQRPANRNDNDQCGPGNGWGRFTRGWTADRRFPLKHAHLL